MPWIQKKSRSAPNRNQSKYQRALPEVAVRKQSHSPTSTRGRVNVNEHGKDSQWDFYFKMRDTS